MHTYMFRHNVPWLAGRPVLAKFCEAPVVKAWVSSNNAVAMIIALIVLVIVTAVMEMVLLLLLLLPPIK